MGVIEGHREPERATKSQIEPAGVGVKESHRESQLEPEGARVS